MEEENLSLIPATLQYLGPDIAYHVCSEQNFICKSLLQVPFFKCVSWTLKKKIIIIN